MGRSKLLKLKFGDKVTLDLKKLKDISGFCPVGCNEYLVLSVGPKAVELMPNNGEDSHWMRICLLLPQHLPAIKKGWGLWVYLLNIW
jgi:hypothetical protein